MGRREIAVIVVAVTIAAAVYSAVFFYWRPIVLNGRRADVACFYRAGKMVLAGEGSQVYDFQEGRRFDDQLRSQIAGTEKKGSLLPFLYTPPSLLLFAPLAALQYREAEITWFVMNAAVLLLLPIWLGRELRLRSDAVFISILFPALLIPVALALMLGQSSFLILGLLGAVFAALHRGWNATAGVLLALATIKPQLIIAFLMAFVAARNWRLVASFLATGLGLLVASVALVGWRTIIALPGTILAYSHLPLKVGGEVPETMPGVRGLASVLFRSSVERATFLLLVTGLCLGLVWLANRRGTNPSAFALTLVVSLMVGYHSYMYDMVLVVLLLPILSSGIAARGWNWARRTVALGLAALVIAPFLPGEVATMAFYFSLIMLALLVALYNESCREGSLAAHRGSTEDCGGRRFSYGDGSAAHPSLGDARS